MYPRSLKLKSVFIIGFGIGFSLALLLFQSQDWLLGQSSCQKLRRQKHVAKDVHFKLPLHQAISSDQEILFQHWIKGNVPVDEPSPKIYREWLEERNMQIKSINLDEFLYGPVEKRALTKTLESDWLTQHVHVTCIVFVEKIELAKAIGDTWGQRCNRLYLFGQNLHNSKLKIINVNTKVQSSWQLLCEAMNYVWKKNTTLEWIIFAKDDTIVIPENLRYIVAPLNHTDDYYLGHTIVMWGQPYNMAQAGYVLSVATMEKIVERFNTSEKCLKGGKYWKKEDYYLGKHLTSIGIHPSDTKDRHLRTAFHRYSLPNLLWGAVNPDDNWTPVYQSCCSPLTVTFSAGETGRMYTYNYLLYHLQALNRIGTYGGRPAPTPVPEVDVWKIVLKEEFNITYWQNITSERYFEIWSINNSQVGETLGRQYKNMPEILSAVLTAYELHNNPLDKDKLDVE